MPVATKSDLKPLPDCPFSKGVLVHTTFKVCKILERKHQWLLFDAEPEHPKSSNILQDLTPVVTGQVLGYGLLYPPSDARRDILAANVIACKGNGEKLAVLAHLYIYTPIRICMSLVASCLPPIDIEQFTIQRQTPLMIQKMKAHPHLGSNPSSMNPPQLPEN